MQLKIAIKNINDIFTYKTTLKLLDWIKNNFRMNDEDHEITKTKILRTKPNANGYDIRIDSLKIIAEIKCNLPLNNGNTFGKEQRYQIEKDIRNLLNGKNKVTDLTNDDYYKFLGIYNFGEGTKQAVKNLFKYQTFNEFEGKVEILDGFSNISKDKVYIVLVE